MKKFLFGVATLFSSAVFAATDGYSCRVYGADNVVSVVRTTSKAEPCGLSIYVALTKPAQEDMTIVVNVKDGSTIIGTAHVPIKKGEKTPGINGRYLYTNPNLQNGKLYTLTIAKASCK